MINITSVNGIREAVKTSNKTNNNPVVNKQAEISVNKDLKKVDSELLKAYHPSFGVKTNPSEASEEQPQNPQEIQPEQSENVQEEVTGDKVQEQPGDNIEQQPEVQEQIGEDPGQPSEIQDSQTIPEQQAPELQNAVNPETVAAENPDNQNPADMPQGAAVAPENVQPEAVQTDKKNSNVSDKEKLKTVSEKLDKDAGKLLKALYKAGKLSDNSAQDGSTVLDNLYGIATEARIPGLKDSQILTEVLTAIANPASITQKFGDIPDNVAAQIESETQEKLSDNAKNVISSCCVVASMEYNLASKMPSEFARFARELSGENYSVDKNIKLSDLSEDTAESLWVLKKFKTESTIDKDWENVNVKIQPDRNAIVRARIQSTYRDPGERSCTDVLIQSALLNFGSQATYDALTDERTGELNPEKNGLTDFEKTVTEEVVFAKPKVAVVYQQIDENGYLTGYNCSFEETKQHILNSLRNGENVIIGYTHMDADKKVDGGHEITITDYKQDKNGKGVFICNDTDDDLDEEIQMPEEELLPLIHHAGISKAALNGGDEVVESWRQYLDEFHSSQSMQ